MGRNFELNDGLLRGCTPRRSQSIAPNYHHYHLYFLFLVAFFKKIIWNITCFVSGGWKEDLIPLLFGSVQTR